MYTAVDFIEAIGLLCLLSEGRGKILSLKLWNKWKLLFLLFFSKRLELRISGWMLLKGLNEFCRSRHLCIRTSNMLGEGCLSSGAIDVKTWIFIRFRATQDSHLLNSYILTKFLTGPAPLPFKILPFSLIFIRMSDPCQI